MIERNERKGERHVRERTGCMAAACFRCCCCWSVEVEAAHQVQSCRGRGSSPGSELQVVVHGTGSQWVAWYTWDDSTAW